MGWRGSSRRARSQLACGTPKPYGPWLTAQSEREQRRDHLAVRAVRTIPGSAHLIRCSAFFGPAHPNVHAVLPGSPADAIPGSRRPLVLSNRIGDSVEPV